MARGRCRGGGADHLSHKRCIVRNLPGMSGKIILVAWRNPALERLELVMTDRVFIGLLWGFDGICICLLQPTGSDIQNYGPM